jgi:Na+/proline symporter
MNVIVIAWVNLALVKILKVLFPDFLFFGHETIQILGITFSAHLLLTAGIMVFVAIYSALSGLWGISFTDSFQFVVAMTGCIVLAIVAINHTDVGGVAGLKAKLSEETFHFFPQVGSSGAASSGTNILQLSLLAFIAYIGIQWWASWYPGAEPGGGGYIAQRMMSAKNEKHSLLATLWFQIAHYALRPWPWIIVALVALTVFPKAQDAYSLRSENPYLYALAEKASTSKEVKTKYISLLSQPDNTLDKLIATDPALAATIEKVNQESNASYNAAYLSSVDFGGYMEKWENTTDPGKMFPKLMLLYLPSGLLGLLIAAFLAAYMSTLASQTNWGTSYIINDLYRPFVKPGASEKYYVNVSRVTTFLLMILSLVFTSQLDRISDAWKIVLALSAGIGPVLILRWFWWRVNAWSEISAMLAPYAIFPVLKYAFGFDIIGRDFEKGLIVVVAWSTLVWLVVTFFTKPVEDEKLKSFYRKVHPGGPGWKRIAQLLPDVKQDEGYKYLFVCWILGCVLVMSCLFGFGKLIFHEYIAGVIFLIVSALCGYGIYLSLSKQGWDKLN